MTAIRVWLICLINRILVHTFYSYNKNTRAVASFLKRSEKGPFSKVGAGGGVKSAFLDLLTLTLGKIISFSIN